jgi:hypothetical protein
VLYTCLLLPRANLDMQHAASVQAWHACSLSTLCCCCTKACLSGTYQFKPGTTRMGSLWKTRCGGCAVACLPVTPCLTSLLQVLHLLP